MSDRTFRRFDAAEYLKTPEARIEFLRAAREDGDRELRLRAIAIVRRARAVAAAVEAVPVPVKEI